MSTNTEPPDDGRTQHVERRWPGEIPPLDTLKNRLVQIDYEDENDDEDEDKLAHRSNRIAFRLKRA